MIKTKKGKGLKSIWKTYLKLRVEGDKLHTEGNKLCAEGNKLRVEGDKLRAEGNKLYTEGDKLWMKAVMEIKGNITMEWINKDGYLDCKLGTGEIFSGKGDKLK